MGEEGGGEREPKKASAVHCYQMCLCTAALRNSAALAVSIAAVGGALGTHCTESMSHLFLAVVQGSGTQEGVVGSPGLCSSKLCS